MPKNIHFIAQALMSPERESQLLKNDNTKLLFPLLSLQHCISSFCSRVYTQALKAKGEGEGAASLPPQTNRLMVPVLPSLLVPAAPEAG